MKLHSFSPAVAFAALAKRSPVSNPNKIVSRICSLGFLAVGAAMVVFPQAILAATYTFDGLSPGQLSGQDNWITLPNNSSYVITSGTGFDTTHVVQNPGTSGASDVHYNGRENNGNYSFGNLSGFPTVTLSFDTQVQNNGSQDQFINFGLGNVTHDTYGSPGFAFRQTNGGTPIWALGGASYNGGPAAGSTSGNLPGGINTGDWIRLQLVMDMTANGGVGMGNLYFTDLTQSGSQQLLTSNFNLNLDPVGNLAIWDTMWSRSDFNSSVVIDNLTVTPSPEPSTWLMLGGGAIGLLGFRRRR
ncbi:MAG: PEP-CTERM sorting domain-containing protein [Chthoniobacter sp.]|nr:PEP-CTERM sorting domain-containing protein [Chthoniobacter sp.]